MSFQSAAASLTFMTGIDGRAAVANRDRGLQRLRRWTVGCAITAAGLVGLVAVLAAGTFPGRGIVQAAASAGTTTDDQPPQPSDSSSSAAPAQSGSGQLGAPSSGFFGSGSGGGAPAATSGGS
jgi:hypothetical protein